MSSDHEDTSKRTSTTKPAEKKAKVAVSRARGASVLTFTADHDEYARLQILSTHTLFDLVASLCQHTAVGYEGSEGPHDHMWHVTHRGRKYVCGSEFRDTSHDSRSGGADATKLDDLDLTTDCILKLTYDYGSTSNYSLRLVGREDLTGEEPRASYPRNQPISSVPASYEKFVPAGDINLDAMFPGLQEYIFEGNSCNVNLFQAGSKKNYGFVDKDGKMLFLPAKPDNLTDWLGYFEQGSRVRSNGGYTWHSVVMIPESKMTLQLQKKYQSDNEPGFTDCIIVDDQDSDVLTAAFPKIAALAGLKKDNKVKKGWISFCTRGNNKCNLSICSGQARAYKSPAPKGTAFDGDKQHDPVEEPLFMKSNVMIKGLHDVFCEVEGLLMTL